MGLFTHFYSLVRCIFQAQVPLAQELEKPVKSVNYPNPLSNQICKHFGPMSSFGSPRAWPCPCPWAGSLSDPGFEGPGHQPPTPAPRSLGCRQSSSQGLSKLTGPFSSPTSLPAPTLPCQPRQQKGLERITTGTKKPLELGGDPKSPPSSGRQVIRWGTAVH